MYRIDPAPVPLVHARFLDLRKWVLICGRIRLGRLGSLRGEGFSTHKKKKTARSSLQSLSPFHHLPLIPRI